MFLSFECPVSNSYMAPLSEMAKEFGKFGVTFWGLTTNEDDTPEQIAKSAKQFDLAFPVFKDERLRAADALKAGLSRRRCSCSTATSCCDIVAASTTCTPSG